jgi:predicted DNA binding protein
MPFESGFASNGAGSAEHIRTKGYPCGSIGIAMPCAKLRITVPEGIWIGKLSRECATAEFEILTAFPKERGGIALAEITDSDPKSVVRAMEGTEEVTNIEPLQQTTDSILVQFETSDPFLLLPVRKAGTPIELPFTVCAGEVGWEITATQDRLSELGDQLREFDITFDVKSVTHQVETTQLLTAKQTKLVNRAIEAGYYDTPRRVTLTDLADDLDLAKSTCSETLHRAEEKIIKQFASDIGNIETEKMATPSQ